MAMEQFLRFEAYRTKVREFNKQKAAKEFVDINRSEGVVVRRKDDRRARSQDDKIKNLEEQVKRLTTEPSVATASATAAPQEVRPPPDPVVPVTTEFLKMWLGRLTEADMVGYL
jgi:hypothetical protein